MAQSTYRLYCKQKGQCGRDYCVTVRDGKLCLALPNNCDPCQIWQKDEGNKCTFMLINKATNKAVKYCGNGDALHLVNKPGCPDKSVTWTANEDITCGYGYIRTQCHCNMVMDAWENKICDGTKISIYPQKTTSNVGNQLWKLTRC